MPTVIQKLSTFLILMVLFSCAVQIMWFIGKSQKDSSLEVLTRSVKKFQETSNFTVTDSLPIDISFISKSYPQPTSSPHPPTRKEASSSVSDSTPDLEESESQTNFSDGDYHILVVIVLSKQRERRDAIRDTWKSTHYHQPHYNVTVKFSLGTLGLNSSEVEELESEQSEYEDMILLPDLYDSYDNLTRKVLYSFQWVDQHLQYSYLFKCDDDSFALLDRMAHELANMSPYYRGLYWGYFTGNSRPKVEGDWAELEWFACDNYLPYALGGGYVLSANVVRGVLHNADALTMYKSEDVAIGMWTSSFDIERKHDVRFDVQELSRGCLNDFIVTHKQSIEDMYKKHDNLLTRKVLCDKENLWTQYIYNWRKRPTKCCRHSLPQRFRHRPT